MGPIQRPNKCVLEALSMGAMRPESQQSSAEVKNGTIHPLPHVCYGVPTDNSVAI
jgi:hypothetical protein